MSSLSPTIDEPIASALQADGYAFVPAAVMREELGTLGRCDDWAEFVDSWNALQPDTHMADQGRYRRRRHAVYSACSDGAIQRQPHQPHYQSREYNSLNGGIERWFAPVQDSIGSGITMVTVLRYCATRFTAMAPGVRAWHVEVHQFRIEARVDEPGLPTPEGVHRDGVDFVLVLLVARHNIERGITTIHRPDGLELGSFTLSAPFDAALVDDNRVCHGVTAVEAKDPQLPAYRDVLVVTFRRSDAEPTQGK